MAVIVVSAVCLERCDGSVLTVRKRNTDMFMLPGGKPEAGESAADCAVREVNEELGISLDAAQLRLLGTFVAAAANEADTVVQATVFHHPGDDLEPRPLAEIERCRWVDPAAAMTDATEAPLNRAVVFPRLLAERASRL